MQLGVSKTMRILIIGFHGFVSSNLVDSLKKEHTIHGVNSKYFNRDCREMTKVY